MIMLEFKKEVLQKVSFDPVLFEKELTKAISWMQQDEVDELKIWCYQKFEQDFKSILDKVF